MNKPAFTTLLLVFLLGACEPSDTRPGLWLSGEVEAFPADWSFTDNFQQIAVQVATPYAIPHSVTIWCVQVEGTLYIGALVPESKSWPGWAESDPDIKLKLGDRLFEGRLQKIVTHDEIRPVSDAYIDKYQLATDPITVEGSPSWFWRVTAR